ncbi:ATPase, F1/V1/A1 complex, alpha/beta subunit, Zinc knuckle CX2CX4HX4C [Artemisia annua]|uniref:ATPase, F1/V1/A1 complex, alpha/beta subunit, Zinc knuckle CX2CX4HX4C n=1 Tax=Artemisia annua TaxID=35608 RepID=A0A2U1M331_ARTAN|nr:ATPase, F1/V1/A1 complex, alpha/beta subunit, Zinc knuckle CX2CX4HX4C [Artemisia annua]
MGSNVAFAGTNQKSTLVEEVNNTHCSPIAACEKSCDDRVLLGNSGHDDTLKDPPSRQHVLSLVETDLCKPNVDTSIIDTNVKVQDSASTSGTSAMCINPWGRYSYAAVHDILEFVEVDIPLPNEKGHYTEYIDIEYEWWPPRCPHGKIFSHEVGTCQALKRQVVLGSDDEHVSAKEKVHVKKAGKKGTKVQAYKYS